MSQQFAVSNISDLVTTLGFIHVVRGNQHSQSFGGERVNLIPELSPRLGVHAGGGLVEQQQLWARQRASAQRQALLPPTRKLGRELFFPAGKAESLDCAARGGRRVVDAIDPADELQIL